jgi:hypothetical protein
MTAALCCFGISKVATAAKDSESVVTAVFSRSFNKYERPVRPDGSDQPLTYVVAKGGAEEGMHADESMSDVKFAGIVRALGSYLAKQAYYPAKDAKKAELMLVVHWGKTLPGNDGFQRNLLDQGLQAFGLSQQLQMGSMGATTPFAMPGPIPAVSPEDAAVNRAASEQLVQGLTMIRFAQDARIDANRQTANLLGYTSELIHRDNPSLYGGAGSAYYDLIEDIESERYYISVTAYDFQDALKNSHKKGLWRTVASIDARGNRFDERLTAMIERASKYFGRDSGRLIRQFEYTPHIKMGELKQLGIVETAPSERK